MKKIEISRETGETTISIKLKIDGKGEKNIDLGTGFFDHMLDLFAKYGLFDLELKCLGYTQRDSLHKIEDVGITLGLAFKKAIGD